MKHPKPKWWLLYAVLPVGAALLVAADLVAPSAGCHMVAEGAAARFGLGLMACWVRANRLALALLGAPGAAEQPLRAWVAYRPPAVPWRRGGTSEIESTLKLAASRPCGKKQDGGGDLYDSLTASPSVLIGS